MKSLEHSSKQPQARDQLVPNNKSGARSWQPVQVLFIPSELPGKPTRGSPAAAHAGRRAGEESERP